MMTKTQLLALINTNLTDNRLYSIQVYLETLTGSRPRVKDTATNTVITSLANLQTALNSLTMEVGFNYENNSAVSKMTPTIHVTFTNILVSLSKHDTDDVYTMKYGTGDKLLQFEMGYLSDGDTVVPLKILRINLVDPVYYI